jgi:hypothetical protein
MHSINVSLLVFAIVSGGVLLGIFLRRVLPEEHFNADAKVVIRLSTGFVVTMTGLVLGMLVSSAKASYDAQKVLVAQVSFKIILFDRSLREYGPESKMIRSQLRGYVEATMHRVWPDTEFTSVQLEPRDSLDRLERELKTLEPKSEEQSSSKAQAIAILGDLRQASWLLFVQSETNSLSMPLLVVLVSWLVAIFLSFGLLAPPNPTVIVNLLVGALAVSAAILIILEMYSPFNGILRITSAPIQDALSQIGR